VANRELSRSLLWPAVLVGIGVAGSLDETVLHQLLRWHHFYDRGSQAAGLIAERHLPSRLDRHAGHRVGAVGLAMAHRTWPTAAVSRGHPAWGRRLQPV
jgi:uncharacterized membrane protein